MAKVLLIDDDVFMLNALEILVKALCHEAIKATNGEEGLVKAIQHRPDLIVLDLLLPKKDGLTVCDELRRLKRTANTPIIVLSSLDGEWDRQDALRRGVNDYLTKPVNRQAFMNRLRMFLRETD